MLESKTLNVAQFIKNVTRSCITKQFGVTKKIYPVVPPKVEYSLTEFGKTVIPVIGALGMWGDENEARLREVILRRLPSGSL